MLNNDALRLVLDNTESWISFDVLYLLNNGEGVCDRAPIHPECVSESSLQGQAQKSIINGHFEIIRSTEPSAQTATAVYTIGSLLLSVQRAECDSSADDCHKSKHNARSAALSQHFIKH